jgi:hypothetical protein
LLLRSGLHRFDHRHDACLDCFRQARPCGNDGREIGIRLGVAGYQSIATGLVFRIRR